MSSFAAASEINDTLNYENPIMIITAGPTGSGKSQLLEKTLDVIYKSSELMQSFERLSMDDYVQDSECYKSKVDRILKMYENTGRNLNNPSKLLLKQMSDAYFNIRNKGPCTGPCNNKSIPGCDDIYDSDLNDIISSSKNVVIETTGKMVPIWYLEKLVEKSKFGEYNVIFAYSLVEFEALRRRNISRSKTQIKSFIKDYMNKPAPRFPDISTEIFKNATKEIIDVLLLIRNECMAKPTPRLEQCGQINNSNKFTLLIFDNNNRPSELIYDSRNPEHSNMSDTEFKELLDGYHLSGGNPKRGRIHKSKNMKKQFYLKKTIRKMRVNK